MSGRIMAVDYGKKRTGTAVSDMLRVIATPGPVFDTKSPDFMAEISAYVSGNKVSLILVGMPEQGARKDGLPEEIREFGEKLAEMTGVEMLFRDEAFSSRKAINVMVESGRNKKFRRTKENVDSFSAAIILKEYLDETA